MGSSCSQVLVEANSFISQCLMMDITWPITPLLSAGHDLPRDCLPRPGQKRDCLCELPDTLLSHVLSFVGDLCSAVALLLRVSRGYRAFAAGHPILWAHVRWAKGL